MGFERLERRAGVGQRWRGFGDVENAPESRVREVAGPVVGPLDADGREQPVPGLVADEIRFLAPVRPLPADRRRHQAAPGPQERRERLDLGRRLVPYHKGGDIHLTKRLRRQRDRDRGEAGAGQPGSEFGMADHTNAWTRFAGVLRDPPERVRHHAAGVRGSKRAAAEETVVTEGDDPARLQPARGDDRDSCRGVGTNGGKGTNGANRHGEGFRSVDAEGTGKASGTDPGNLVKQKGDVVQFRRRRGRRGSWRGRWRRGRRRWT